MKFNVKHVATSGRLGCLSALEKLPGEKFETPLLVMYTRGGNIPHITHEVLQMITTNNLIMHMPLTTILPAFEGLKDSSQSLSGFVGMKEYPAYVTPQDPAVQTPAGYNVSDKVAIWTKNGKCTLDPQRYMTMVETMKPDMYLALCDGDTDLGSSKKRVSKSLLRSSKLFRECFRIRESSKVLKNIPIFAPIEGGYDRTARRVCAEEIVKYDVNGYVIDGLHTNGPEAEEIKYQSIEAVIADCLDCLPKEKLRVIHGAWNPVTLLHLVAAGFDVFDTSLPYLVTERGAALTFPYDVVMDVAERRVGSTQASNTDTKVTSCLYEICLEDKVYFEDFQPLLKNCGCLACQQHTRAYIHHLLTSQELLGKVLLMIHNLHHYLEFFKSIRRAIENGTLDALSSLVKVHCEGL